MILADLSPIHSILSMLVLFITAALSLYLAGYHLMGILYVLIYVGAIAILFLFIVSLLKIKHLANTVKTSPLVVVALATVLIPFDLTLGERRVVEEAPSLAYQELSHVGTYLYCDSAIMLVVTGVILILSIIGAIAVTRR